MDTGAVIFFGVVFLIAFGVGSLLARRVVPAAPGEPWTQRGKRNVITMLAGWGILAVAGGAVLLIGN